MRRYIDADILKNKTTRVNHIWNGTTNAEGKGLDEIIDDIPTADVVEVVRCKDCKYRDTMPEYEYDDDHEHRTLMGTDFCRWWHDESPNDDDFCSFGERADA